MGGARLRVETSFEKTSDSIGRSTASLGFRREYVGYACNRYILAPCSQGARSYLVDPASSHMLVSKIKPCMSKYKHYTVKLRMAH